MKNILLWQLVGVLVVLGMATRTARAQPCSGMEDLGTLDKSSYAYAVSANGLVVVGQANIGPLHDPHAFRWTASTGMQDLGSLGGTLVFALGVSGDGSVIVGRSATAGNSALHAFRWTASAGMQDLTGR
ncbi:MAG: hypothetical protein L6Q35_11100 [Phycisphaerales bacterium]|nr:hypothetical protein [Phycisphaerales bacterium]